jgi:hypothetical protein
VNEAQRAAVVHRRGENARIADRRGFGDRSVVLAKGRRAASALRAGRGITRACFLQQIAGAAVHRVGLSRCSWASSG